MTMYPCLPIHLDAYLALKHSHRTFLVLGPVGLVERGSGFWTLAVLNDP